MAAKKEDLKALIGNLTESERRYRSLFESMVEGVALHETIYDDSGVPTDYRIVDVNPSFETNTGIVAERIRGRTAREYYGTGEAPFLEIYARVASGDTPESFETFFVPLQRYFHISVFSPKKGWFATVITDISERKRHDEEQAAASREIEQQHTLFSGIINSAVFDIYSLDKNYCYTCFNRQHAETMKALFGVDIEQGKSILDFISIEKDKTAMKRNLDRALAGEIVKTGEYFGDNSLSRQYLEPSFKPILNPDGDVIGVAVISHDATERKKSERALRESEERYRRLTENSRDIIFRLTLPDQKFEYVNPAALALTGHTPDEFYQNPHLMQEIIHPDFHEKLTMRWERVLKGDIPQEYEYRIVHSSGEPRWFYQRNAIIKDSTGHVVALEGIVTDITDRKTTEIALKQIEERYQLISENTGDVIWILNPESGKFSFVSPSVYHQLGYTADEIMDLSLSDILTPESQVYVNNAIPATLDAIRSGDESARIQTHRIDQVRKDGSIITVEIVTTLLTGTDQTVTEVLGVSRDITERRKAHAALEESEERYRSFVESANEAIFVIQDGFIPFCNKKGLELIGFDLDYLKQHSFLDLVHPDDKAAALDRHMRRLQGEVIDPMAELRVFDAGGTLHWLEINAVIVPGDGKPATLNFATDITERKKADNALRKSEHHYHLLADNVQDVIWTADQDMNLTYVSPSVTTLTGYSPEEFLQLRPQDSLTPDSLQKLMTSRETCLEKIATGSPDAFKPQVLELEYLRRDGVSVWTEVVINLIQSGDGVPQGVIGVTREITDRKLAEEAIRESEERFRTLLQSAPTVAIQGYRPDHTVVYWNDANTRIYGYTAEEAIGRDLRDLIIPAPAREEVTAAIARMVETGIAEPAAELELQHKDGHRVPVFSSHSIVKIPGKDPILFCIDIDLTERKRAEQAIRESEEKFRELVEHSTDIIYTIDFSGVLTSISPAVYRIMGYSPEELIGKNIREYLTAESLERATAEIEKKKDRTELSSLYEVQMIAQDGSYIPFELNSRLRMREGRPHDVLGIARDISQRKQVEEALRNSEDYLKSILNSIQTGLVVIDPQTHIIVDINPAAEQMIGKPREEIIGSVCHQYICPTDGGNCPVTDLDQSIDNSERVLITASGPRSVLKTVIPTVLSQKQYLLESFIDITDRKQAEEKLAESEEKFHLIFKNSNDAIYLFEITPSGMPGRIVDANEMALLQTGQKKEDLLKKTFLEIHSRELPQKSRAIMMELLTKGQIRFETDVLRRDGTKLPVEVSAQFARLNQKTYVIAISRDISRRKREERALRIANQKLQLMNIVAWHDIQNKVTGLRGYVELSKDIVTDETMKKFIRSEEEVLKVIHQQLQYTKEYQEMGIHPQEWINLQRTLHMAFSLSSLGSIQMDIDVGDLEIFCDPVIAKVFSHLIDNTKMHGETATRIHISCRESADGLTLIYEDDGVGIPCEQKKELFLRNVGTSSGFSLFFIHDLLEVSEMTIKETGIPGEGVRFEIGVPRGIYRFGHASP